MLVAERDGPEMLARIACDAGVEQKRTAVSVVGARSQIIGATIYSASVRAASERATEDTQGSRPARRCGRGTSACSALGTGAAIADRTMWMPDKRCYVVSLKQSTRVWGLRVDLVPAIER